MGKGGGGTQATNTIQNADPWIGAQPFIKDVLAQAGTQFRQPLPQFFPQNTVGPQAPETVQSQQMAVSRAAGSPLEQAAQAENMRTVQGQYLGLSPAQPLWNATMRGDMLNSNPYLDAMFAKAARPVTQQFTDVALPGISSMFSQAGRYGSGAQQTAVQNLADTYGRTLGDMSAGIYGQNFANERQMQASAARDAQQAFGTERLMQQQATGMAPQIAATDWRNIGMLGNVGADRQAQAQSLVNDAVARWDFTQQQPAQRLAEYARLISGAPGGTASNSTSIAQLPPPNRLGSAAGGAAMGGAAGGMIQGAEAGSTMGGWGALIGGLLGYLGS